MAACATRQLSCARVVYALQMSGRALCCAYIRPAGCRVLSLLTCFGTLFGNFWGQGQQTVFKCVCWGTHLIWRFLTGVGNRLYRRNYIFGRWRQVHDLICFSEARRSTGFRAYGVILRQRILLLFTCAKASTVKSRRSIFIGLLLVIKRWFIIILFLDLHRFN